MAFRRPRSLAGVARAARRDGDVYGHLRAFLDYFYTHPHERGRGLAREPALLDDPVANAYLAAAAEHLALRYRHPMPAWTLKSDRFLHRAHFGGPSGMRALLLVESPSAFRRRMIFVDHDPLGRPLRKGRRPQPPAWGAPAKKRSA
jgi:hypothetical protein